MDQQFENPGVDGNPGNENFDAYISQKTYVYNVELQNMFGASALIQKYGNKDLEWQRTVDKNIGVDLSILNNRIRVTFDYYLKTRTPCWFLSGCPLLPRRRAYTRTWGGKFPGDGRGH